MSIPIQLIKRDSCFVQEQFNTLRQILFIRDNGQVYYYQYDLSTGKPENTFPGVCRRKQITRWAERIATGEEIASLRADISQLRMAEAMKKIENYFLTLEE